MARLLALAGRRGPMLLLAGVAIGFVFPWLARAARPMMDTAVFFFTLGAFLKVDLPGFRSEVEAAGLWRNLLILAWATFGVPLTTAALIALVRPAPALAEGLLLCTLAPPVGSAAAIAAMLTLSAPLALFASVAATVVAPMTMPALASALGGYTLQLDPWPMMIRLFVIIGGACLVSWMLRRYASRFVADNPSAMTGIAVMALILFALGAMQGMQAYFVREPRVVELYLLVAFAANAGLQALGTALFWARGRDTALTMGLVSGNRNIGLAWAAVGNAMPPLVEVYFAMSVLPIYVLPALLRRLVVRLRATRRVSPGNPIAVDPPRLQTGAGAASLAQPGPRPAHRNGGGTAP